MNTHDETPDDTRDEEQIAKLLAAAENDAARSLGFDDGLRSFAAAADEKSCDCCRGKNQKAGAGAAGFTPPVLEDFYSDHAPALTCFGDHGCRFSAGLSDEFADNRACLRK